MCEKYREGEGRREGEEMRRWTGTGTETKVVGRYGSWRGRCGREDMIVKRVLHGMSLHELVGDRTGVMYRHISVECEVDTVLASRAASVP